MDNKALFKLPYGVFLLATKADGKANACITNTCIQVASNPVRIAISSISTNYTCELLRKSGKFTISLLDTNCSFDTIKYFGMQSGRDVDKLADIPLPEDENGIPYMGWNACCVLSAEVVDSIDLGSHFLFIAEVKDAKILGDGEPMTYTYYQENVKPKPAAPAAEKKITGWRCKICGHIYKGETLPADYICPLCGHGADDFEPIYD